MENERKVSDEQLRLAHEYAWNWFSLHANQRLALFNLSLIALGALTAGCASAFSQDWNFAAALSATVSVLIAVAFLRLDQRNSDLTKMAEQQLAASSEALLSTVVGSGIKFCSLADHPSKTNFYTFGQIVRSVYWTAIAIGLVASGVAYSRLLPPLKGICQTGLL